MSAQQGKGRGAFDMLSPFEQQRAGEVAYDYLLGVAAIDAGEYARAVFALERVLAIEPGNAPARAAIARAYFQMGENTTARQEFEAVKAARPPAEVASIVDRFLSALDDRQANLKSGVTGFLEAGLGHDSNANAASGASGYAIPALPTFVFNGGKRSDWFGTLGAGISGRYMISTQSTAYASAGLNRRYNQQVDTADTGALFADAGLAHRFGNHEVSGALQAQTFDVDNARFRDAFGGVVQYRYRLSGTQQVSAYAQLTRLTYPNLATTRPGFGVPAQTDRNANRSVLGVAWANSFLGPYAPAVFAGLYVGEERLMTAAFPEFGHRLWGVRGGGQITLSPQWLATGSISYESRHYGFPEAAINQILFPFNRSDREWNARIGATYAISRNWSFNPSFSFTDAGSNVIASAYRRNIIAATIRYDFR